jgi:hypothetical protein
MTVQHTTARGTGMVVAAAAATSCYCLYGTGVFICKDSCSYVRAVLCLDYSMVVAAAAAASCYRLYGTGVFICKDSCSYVRAMPGL